MNTILTHLKVKHGLNAYFKPEDFGNRAVAGMLFRPTDRRLHAMLRLMGFSKLEAFCAAFTANLRGTPELLTAAAEAYEQSRMFTEERDELLATIDSDALEVEHDARIAELSTHARDAAVGLRVALQDYKPSADKDIANFDAYCRVLNQRQEELSDAAHRYRLDNTPNELSQSETNERELNVGAVDRAHALFWFGKLPESWQGAAPTAYDPNTQTNIFKSVENAVKRVFK